jgi:hypothetical protein
MMSFGEALGFPFKAENLPKTLNLILIYVIITSSVMVLGLLANAIELALLISGIVSIGYSFFVSGYMIEVIRNVMDGNEILPPSDLGRDIKRGFAVFIASLVHMIPFIILFACALGAIGSSMNMGSMEFSRDMERLGNSGDGGAILMVCGLSIVALFAGFFVFNALLIGMVRYAAEDRAGAMFEFGTNLSYVDNGRRLSQYWPGSDGPLCCRKCHYADTQPDEPVLSGAFAGAPGQSAWHFGPQEQARRRLYLLGQIQFNQGLPHGAAFLF